MSRTTRTPDTWPSIGVGIKSIRHPVKVMDKSSGVQHTIANFSMYVYLPHHFKGTHMSRFVEILNSYEREISVESFEHMLRQMVERLEAESGHVEMNFPYFVNKKAPMSGVESLMDYDVTFTGEIKKGEYLQTMKVLVPVHQPVPLLEKNLRIRRTQPTLARHHHRAHQRLRLDRGDHQESPRTTPPANSTACSSARTRSSSPNTPTTIPSSSRTACATSPRP
jgi:GTP cyclohydrolase FolE2